MYNICVCIFIPPIPLDDASTAHMAIMALLLKKNEIAHCKKRSVDFTVKHLASSCQSISRYFYGRLLVEHF